MKVYKKIGIGFLLFFGLLFFLGVWYRYTYSMDLAASMEINSPNLKQKILIATQGSEFKDKVTFDILEHYKSRPIFIKVIDVTGLPNVDPKEYNAIIVIHTWENWKPPLTVEKFIKRTMPYKEKIVVLTTSGKGSYKMEDIDAIAGESIIKNAEEFSDKIISRVDTILVKD
ncbi:hypothetical protein ACFO3O_11960 [Dokdonia ponticola]|uniref:Flavodoxin domain-containing protein n=1 Tax=Dokdonia ponticola TaxID=2041041 RepID=A0ABV9HXB5_9FLAO